MTDKIFPALCAALVALFAFFAGFSVGKGKAEKIPVFIEIPAETTVASAETTVTTATKPEYTEIELTATAYCPCEKCCGKYGKNRPKDENGDPIVYTASGAVAEAGRTIAVDPSVIPYGTEVIINGVTYVAEDCGGAIKGNRIDIYFDRHDDALQFGRQRLTARVKSNY